MTVPRDASREQMEEARARLEAELREITEKADNYWNNPSPPAPLPEGEGLRSGFLPTQE